MFIWKWDEKTIETWNYLFCVMSDVFSFVFFVLFLFLWFNCNDVSIFVDAIAMFFFFLLIFIVWCSISVNFISLFSFLVFFPLDEKTRLLFHRTYHCLFVFQGTIREKTGILSLKIVCFPNDQLVSIVNYSLSLYIYIYILLSIYLTYWTHTSYSRSCIIFVRWSAFEWSDEIAQREYNAYMRLKTEIKIWIYLELWFNLFQSAWKYVQKLWKKNKEKSCWFSIVSWKIIVSY